MDSEMEDELDREIMGVNVGRNEQEEDEDGPQQNGDDGMQEDAEIARKGKSLAELLLLMEDHGPAIPDAVTDHYLESAGFQCNDIRIKRLIGLATQKFITDIATDALSYCKLRQQIKQSDKKGAILRQDKRALLTMEDLSSALAEHGVNIKKPDFFT